MDSTASWQHKSHSVPAGGISPDTVRSRELPSELPAIGKISPEIFDEIILPHLGASSSKVLVGPQHGVDVGVVDLGHDLVMAVTTDPFFIVPQYGWERAAWFAVHILASDASTSGLRPTYMTVDLNLPLSITRDALEVMWTTVHRECEKIGMAIVTGHTARYEGTDYPMVGGATVMSIGPKSKYVTPNMARPGDMVIVTKGPAIEATGLFAVTFPQLIAERYGAEFARHAEEVFWKMSVVDDAMAAASVGVRDDGVTTMHDATECGVWGGLFEIAQASKVGMQIDKEKIIVLPEVVKICDMFQIDPYSSISEGTLLLTCRPHKADEVVRVLAGKGIASSIVGEVTPQEQGVKVFEGGRSRVLEHPRVDPFWPAFGKAIAGASAS
jgi:hydrogenase expression/formation protein HypE